MKLDFNKIQELEQKYNFSGSYICSNTLQQLINTVINNTEPIPSASVAFAMKSLADLGVLVEDEQEKTVKQLNS